MNLSYKQVLAFIFPPSADEVLVASAPFESFTPVVSLISQTTRSLLPYKRPAVRAAIHLAKFHHHDRARALLGQTLAEFIKIYPQHLIIPIPLSKKRYRERGYNQVVEIIKAARKINPAITYSEKVLIRSRHTTPQTELHKTARLHNITGAFKVASSAIPADIHTRTIVLLDDVTTTGATLKAAYQTMSKTGAKSIICVALAH